jgi:hypothetical protein
MMNKIGYQFAQAVAGKDSSTLLELLDPDVNFEGLTPGGSCGATSAQTLVEGILLGGWFGDGIRIDALEDVQTGAVVDRGRVSYRLRLTKPDGTFLVEQQAYFAIENDRINWLRILCSGFRAIDAERTLG